MAYPPDFQKNIVKKYIYLYKYLFLLRMWKKKIDYFLQASAVVLQSEEDFVLILKKICILQI